MFVSKSANLILFFACVTLLVVLLCAFIITLVYKYQKKRMDYIREVEKIKSDYANALLLSQLEIQEQTFLHISREIHDNIGQKLTLAKLYLNTLPASYHSIPETRISDCLQLLTESISGLSDLSRGMSTDFVLSNGLVKAIEHEVALLNRSGIYAARFTIEGEELFLEGNTELVVYRIVQECIHNFVKHAGGMELLIHLQYQPDNLRLTIRDNGIGLNHAGSKGAGMIHMRKRAELLGGSFAAKDVGNGTKIEVSIPVPPNSK